MSHKRIKNTEP